MNVSSRSVFGSGTSRFQHGLNTNTRWPTTSVQNQYRSQSPAPRGGLFYARENRGHETEVDMRQLIAGLTLLCVGVCVTATTGLVYAAYIKLEAPSLSMGQDFSKADYKQLKGVLERKDCKFLGGVSLNEHTSLQYAGDTTAVN